jgi:hypothetical protein
VYIHTRYRRVYPRQEQVPWQIGVCSREAGGLFGMPEIGLDSSRRQTQLSPVL